uniref:Uncharacterized protein n=1 Tax=Oryza meridionalis TaxID=40149 RepID=A0A0E0DBB7_9ORYZ
MEAPAVLLASGGVPRVGAQAEVGREGRTAARLLASRAQSSSCGIHFIRRRASRQGPGAHAACEQPRTCRRSAQRQGTEGTAAVQACSTKQQQEATQLAKHLSLHQQILRGKGLSAPGGTNIVHAVWFLCRSPIGNATTSTDQAECTTFR